MVGRHFLPTTTRRPSGPASCNEKCPLAQLTTQHNDTIPPICARCGGKGSRYRQSPGAPQAKRTLQHPAPTRHLRCAAPPWYTPSMASSCKRGAGQRAANDRAAMRNFDQGPRTHRRNRQRSAEIRLRRAIRLQRARGGLAPSACHPGRAHKSKRNNRVATTASDMAGQPK